MVRFQLRKTIIQIVGGSHYTAIPVEWIKHHRLTKGVWLRHTVDEKGRLVTEPIYEGEEI